VKRSLFSLQMIFGATHSVLSLFMRYSIKLLYKVLKEEPSARVEIPSEEDIREYHEVIASNFPVLNGTWCVVDGLKIPIQKSGDEAAQNAYYNGRLHSHFAESGGLYETLRDVYATRGGIAVIDSALSKKRCPFLIKSGKMKVGETPAARKLRQQATSLWQSAEWGMRAIQGSFPCLKDKMLFSYRIPMLLNFRTRLWVESIVINILSKLGPNGL
jgi:hypothetical protein